MTLSPDFAAKVAQGIRRAHVKACDPTVDADPIGPFPRVSAVTAIPDSQRSKELRRYVERNRERIDAEWDAMPDPRHEALREQRRWASENKARIDADWEQ